MQAVFSVCADEASVGAATAAAMKVTGAVFAGEFREYITAERRPQFAPALKNAASCVALVDFDRDAELALKTAERLQQIFLKRISIVGIGSQLDAGVLLRAMRHGCAEFLTKPVGPDDLAASLNRFLAGTQGDAQVQSGVGRVIAFFGAKGGVGTTMLAVHLATHLVRQHGKKTLLITHTEIFPGTYASTTETADWLLMRLGLHRTAILAWGPMKTQELSEVRAGQFRMAGFAGNSAPDHVDQFHSLPEYLKWLR